MELQPCGTVSEVAGTALSREATLRWGLGAPGELCVKLFADFKLLDGDFVDAHIGGDLFAVLSFLRLFVIAQRYTI